MAKFQKGKSGNPSGRPKSNLGKLLSEYLQRVEGGKRLEQKIVEKVCELAKKGDKDIIKFIWERLEGKVKEQVNIDSDGPVTFTLKMGNESGTP